MRRLLRLLLPALLLAGTLGVASGASLTITSKAVSAFKTCVLSGLQPNTVIADAYVNQTSGSTGTNYGTANFISVLSRASRNQRAFVRFDLSKCSPNIPTSATVKQAVLRLNMNDTPGNNSNRTYQFRRVNAAWTESGLTWANQPAVGPSVSANLTLCAASCGTGYVTVLMTTDVAAFVASPSTNYGWQIADSAEGGSNIEVQFRTGDFTNAPTNPQLVIVYRL